MSLLIFGTTAFDTIETPTGRAERILGGSAMHAAHAARLFCQVQVVSIVGYDFPPAWRAALEARGIGLTGLHTTLEVPTQFWHGRYHANWHEREHLDVDLRVFDVFEPIVPEPYRATSHVFLAHIDPRLQRMVLEQLTGQPFILADTIDYWIINRRADLDQVIQRVDGLIINEGEARLLTGESSSLAAARRLQEQGPRLVIVKRGEYGAILLHESEIVSIPAYPTQVVVDPTGAGDSFAGGLMGHLHDHPNDFRRALAWGTVTASFCVEDFGLSRLAQVHRLELDARFRKLREITQF